MCSVKKVFLEISQNSQENTWASVSFFKKVACNFIKKRHWHRCFPANFVKFLGTSFLQERLWWLLLHMLCCNELLKHSLKLLVKIIGIVKDKLNIGKSVNRSHNFVEIFRPNQYKNDQILGNLKLHTTATFCFLIFLLEQNRLCLVSGRK